MRISDDIHDEMRMLADRIDSTCHIYETDHEFEDSVRCDRCQTTFMRLWEPFKYCPECGARVVSADDDALGHPHYPVFFNGGLQGDNWAYEEVDDDR